MMEYKGYLGHIEYDDQAEIFHGEVIHTRDVITFQGTSVSELRKAFKDSIDDYLAFCAERGEQPDKPFSGQFVTRISPDLHRNITAAAAISGQSLNSWVSEQLEHAVKSALSGAKVEPRRRAAHPKKRTPKRNHQHA
jgi:predicted HicB family RNase H-like nuclease